MLRVEQMYVYFKGVAMLLRGLLDRVREEENGEEEAELFLKDVEKVGMSIF